jgi:hypothetical protein
MTERDIRQDTETATEEYDLMERDTRQDIETATEE